MNARQHKVMMMTGDQRRGSLLANALLGSIDDERARKERLDLPAHLVLPLNSRMGLTVITWRK